jgi:ribonuclease P protein component
LPSRKHTLGKTERLKSRKAIAALFASGKSFSLFPFRVVFAIREEADPRPGLSLLPAFSVSKRHFSSAVKRNRVRRLMKEAFRLSKAELQEQILTRALRLELFIIFQGNDLPEYTNVLNRMQALIKRLKKEVDAQLS